MSTNEPATNIIKVKIPIAIWALGFVSMLMDVSSEMIHSLLPIYITGVLGASNTFVGIIEGIAEATASIVKAFSGAVSDWVKKRKFLLLIGYGLAALTKPIFPLANGLNAIIAARFIDRIGKGIRVAPRDALIADLAPNEIRASSFGLRQSLDSLGAFLGPLLAVFLMWWGNENFKLVFWIAVIPAFAAFFLIVFLVQDPQKNGGNIALTKFAFSDFFKFPPIFFGFLLLSFVFSMARFSEAFLILRASDLGLDVIFIPIVLVIMNIAYSIFAYRAGIIADNIAREEVLAISLLLLIAANIILAFAPSLPVFFLGIMFWGLHLAFSQGVLATMVADFAPKEFYGTAYGYFNLVSGIALLAASVIAGAISDIFGFKAMFFYGAATAFVALGFIWFFYKIGKKGE